MKGTQFSSYGGETPNKYWEAKAREWQAPPEKFPRFIHDLVLSFVQ
jgi:hypothetical protein